MVRAVAALAVLIGLCHATPMPLKSEQRGGASLQVSGGSAVDIQRVPYQAAIELSSEHICGGALIAPRWVLTTADCIIARDKGQLRVRVGSSERESGGELLEVVNVTVHSNFDAVSLSYNVGLLQTRAPAARSPSVRPVALVASGGRPKAGARLLVSGWGKTSLGEFFKPLHLQSLSMAVLSRTLCAWAYKGKALKVDDSTLCARGEEWKGVCEGDFGGPLVNDVEELVGVASWATGCGHPRYPAVFVDLAKDNINAWVRTTAAIKP